MFNVTSPRARGFTLIEMSIVLVIIGLIIGGILKGQELVESARQKNVISQIDSVRAAINSFQDRYKSLPGDFGTANVRINNVLGNGNDDGIISTLTTGFPATQAALAAAVKNAGEEYQFWNQMMAANVLGGGTVSNATTVANFTGGTATSPMPAAAFPQTGLSMVYGTHPGNGTTGDSKTTNWIIVSKFGANAVQVATTSGATSAQRAFQMDNKYDDGLPQSGTIRTLNLVGNCGSGGDAYVATATTTECEVIFAQ